MSNVTVLAVMSVSKISNRHLMGIFAVMPDRFLWPLFALLMGFALGGSFVWALQDANFKGHLTQLARQRAESEVVRPQTVAEEQHGKGTHKGPWYDTFLNHTPDWFVAIFTGLLAFVTLRLVNMTGNLRTSTDKLWQSTERGTRILQRAYISVEPAGISASGTADKCHPNIIIRNAGNLPARNIRWTIDWITSIDHRRKTFRIDPEKLEGSNTLPPGGTMMQGGPIIYVGSDQGDLRNERGLYLYVWGIVYYEDGFGDERTTRFCHRYNSVNLDEAVSVKTVGGIAYSEVVGNTILREKARYHRYGNDAT